MADGGRHFANLSIFPLRQLKGDPTVGHGFANPNGGNPWRESGWRIQKASPARKSLIFPKEDALGEFLQCGGRGDALDLAPITAAMGIFWIEEPRVESGLIAEKKESL